MPPRVQPARPSASDTTIRVEAAVLSLNQFTVADLCERTGLSPQQVRPVLRILREQQYVVTQPAPSGRARVGHRPPDHYQLTSDQTKLQSLADRVFRLRRALRVSERNVQKELELIQSDMTGVELDLDICERATAFEPLDRRHLKEVEARLHRIYGQLESATYEAGIDLKVPESKQHPITAAWDRFKVCKQHFDRVADRWEAGAARKLQIVTDPRFTDSGLFLWMCQDRLRRKWPNIECIAAAWRDVPNVVASHSNSIGFYNRRFTDARLRYWTDLCIYRGYGLLAHRSAALMERPETLAEAETFLLGFYDYWQKKQVQPTIITVGADTVWRFGEQLTAKVPRNMFKEQVIDDANVALEQFRRQKHSLFVGGLPQRLTAEREGYIAVIDANHKPALFSVNGLVHSAALEDKSILHDVTNLWFDTISRLKQDPSFRAEAFQALLSGGATGSGTPFQEWMLERVFLQQDLEIFEETPAGVTSAYVELQADTVRTSIPKTKIVDPLGQQVRDSLTETAMTLGDEWRGPLATHERAH